MPHKQYIAPNIHTCVGCCCVAKTNWACVECSSKYVWRNCCLATTLTILLFQQNQMLTFRLKHRNIGDFSRFNVINRFRTELNVKKIVKKFDCFSTLLEPLVRVSNALLCRFRFKCFAMSTTNAQLTICQMTIWKKCLHSKILIKTALDRLWIAFQSHSVHANIRFCKFSVKCNKPLELNIFEFSFVCGFFCAWKHANQIKQIMPSKNGKKTIRNVAQMNETIRIIEMDRMKQKNTSS